MKGINAYLSVEEADEIISLRLRNMDELRIFWEVLDEDEKEAYLIRSTEQLDRLLIRGKKADTSQALMFPREGTSEVPDVVLTACAFNALGIMNDEIKEAAQKQVNIMSALGMILPQKTAATPDALQPKKLASKTAMHLMKPFLRGGFQIV